MVDAIPAGAGTVDLEILERDRAWAQARTLTVGFPPTPGTFQPWLVKVGPALVALLAATPATGSTTVVLLRTDGGPGGDDLVEVGRTDVAGVVETGGAADIDADGSDELILGSPGGVGRDGCRSSTVWIVRPAEVAKPVAIQVSGQELLGGVLGRWDGLPGDDLLAYARDGCTPSTSDAAVTISALRLRDEALIVSELDVVAQDPDFLGAPLRLTLSGDEPDMDAAVIRGTDGLSILDPSRGWQTTEVARHDTIPLGATPGREAGTAMLTWMDFERDAVVAGSLIGRDGDGALAIGDRIELPVAGQSPDRVRTLAGQAALAIAARQPSVAWHGVVGSADCADLLIQGARLPCGEDTFEVGAAWIGTRPLTTLGVASGRRLLVAAGMESDPIIGVPAVPSPAASDVPGWWRNGGSRPFALAELRAADAVYYREFPQPRSSVERVSEPDATVALPGFTGARLLVQAFATDDGQEPAAGLAVPEIFAGPAPADQLRTIMRIPVPPGLDSGRDGASVQAPLYRATLPDGTTASQWGVRVVPINDWGEVGPMAVGLVQRDSTGPTLVVGEPFTTPVWPLPARLTGSAEPGSTVVVDGVGEARLDRRGAFEFQTTLAPWPQTIRVTATDASGNRTVREVSIIGGVDYRRFPWTVIAAVVIVIAVGASGIRGARRRPSAVGLSGGASGAVIEEWPVAELEELEPGAGLPPARSPR